MLSKNILIDSTLIGTIQFYAYVFNNEAGKIGFGLFPNDGPKPIVCLLNEQGNKISLLFEEDIILKICQQSNYTTAERRVLFKEFLDYVTIMEKKASRMIFKDTKMTYLGDSREVLKYKRLYVHYENSVAKPEKRSMISR